MNLILALSFVFYAHGNIIKPADKKSKNNQAAVQATIKVDDSNRIQKVLILGDSLTEGYGVQKSEAFPAKLEKLLNFKSQGYKVLATGTSGSTSASGLKRLKWHLRSKPNILILALGGNDALRGLKPKSTKANLAEVIKFAQQKGLKVFLAGMKAPTNYGVEYTKKFENTFKDLAKDYDLGLIPFLLKDVGGIAKYNLEDGIHPNEKGHSVIAKNLFSYLKGKL